MKSLYVEGSGLLYRLPVGLKLGGLMALGIGLFLFSMPFVPGIAVVLGGALYFSRFIFHCLFSSLPSPSLTQTTCTHFTQEYVSGKTMLGTFRLFAHALVNDEPYHIFTFRT